MGSPNVSEKILRYHSLKTDISGAVFQIYFIHKYLFFSAKQIISILLKSL
jgi:hypothetical protein